MQTTADRQLDLRFRGQLSPEIAGIFNQIAYIHRADFNELVSEASRPFKESLDWWVEGPASRNTYSSPFFHYYCSLYLIKHLIDERLFNFNIVLVDTPELKKIVEDLLRDNGVSECSANSDSLFKVWGRTLIKRYLVTSYLFYKKIIQHLIAALTRKNELKPAGKSIVLIDTFILPEYTDNDRWYGGLWEYLSDEIKAETYFSATIVVTPIKRFFTVYQQLRKNKRNFIIKEDFLKWEDLLYAFRHRSRLKKMSVNPLRVMGYDMAPVVQRELLNNRDVATVIESILTFRFIGRLRQKQIRLRLAIDWFEGQAIDKAWNMALKIYYPKVKRIGYRPASCIPFYLCTYPIESERDAGVIPDAITVQGRGAIDAVREFMPGLDILLVPSLRSGHVWEHKKAVSKNGCFVVLVALPISIDVSGRIVNCLNDVLDSLSEINHKTKFIIKLHPANSMDEFEKDIKHSISDKLEFTNEKSFPRLLEMANLLITEASSTCLEALGCGVPVIMMENEEGLTYDPVPDSIPEKMIRKTRNSRQLTEALEYFMNLSREERDEQIIYGETIRANFFEPATRDGINRLMNLA